MSARVLLPGLLCLLAFSAYAAKEFVMPRPSHARDYPAREEHRAEKVVVAADPYDLPEKAAVFVAQYLEHDLLPVQLIISNDGSEPIALTGMKVELITARRVRIAPSSEEQLYRRLGRSVRPSDTLGRVPLPIPTPRRQRTQVRTEIRDEIERAQFHARAVEPGVTQYGFLFFDVAGIDNPLHGARLYVSGLRNAGGQELFYFEIAMEKYLRQPAGVPQPGN